MRGPGFGEIEKGPRSQPSENSSDSVLSSHLRGVLLPGQSPISATLNPIRQLNPPRILLKCANKNTFFLHMKESSF